MVFLESTGINLLFSIVMNKLLQSHNLEIKT